MKIDDGLSNIKKAYDEIKAPDEMEQALRAALDDIRVNPAKRSNRGFIRRYRGLIAAAALLLAFLAYSFDTMAYYVKKQNHYDEITNGSIRKLDDSGRGQILGKSCNFSDGSTLTLDKLFFDDNQCVILYALQKKNADPSESLPQLNLLGLFGDPIGYPPEGGVMKDLGNGSFVGMETFEPPAFFEKWMKVKITWVINGKYEERVIPITLSRSQAMFRTVHQNIGKKVELGGSTISFDSISASPLSTSISGNLEGFSQSDEDIMKGNFTRLQFDIAADGKIVATFNAAANSSNGVVTFDSTGEALPGNFNTVQIVNVRFETIKMADKEVDISSLASKPSGDVLLSDDLNIREIRQENNQIGITVESSGTPVMGIIADGKELPLINEAEVNATDSDIKTFIFNGTGSDLHLVVKCINYIEPSDAVIDIR